MNKPTLMGIDLSLTSTGISVQEQTFSIRPKFKGLERLIEISDKICEIANLFLPVGIVIEGYSFASKFTRAHAIGELGGVVKVALRRNGYALIEVPPACRAKFATGRGNAPKVEVLLAAESISGKHFSGASADDAADAWVLEQMAWAQLKESKYSWSPTQLSALEKVNWDPLYKAISSRR
jgi:Holliday junction resolvasome RuvABC endonuclease subunit